MTATLSLEHIGTEVRERITNLLERPELPGNREQPTTIVAGISVVDKQRSDNELGSFVGQMQQYMKDAEALEQKLRAAGVNFLAIMPTTMWNSMCDEAGLYRFNPDNDGRVGASATVLNDIEETATHALGLRPLRSLTIGGLVGGSSVATVAYMLSLPLGWTAAITIAAALSAGYLSGALSERSNFEKHQPRPDKLAKVEATLLSERLANHETTLQALWPERVEGKDVRVKISVPPAPADVQENLFRAAAAKLKLSLAVVGEAISFDESPQELLLRLRSDRYDEIANTIQSLKDAEQRRREEWLNDPIVTTSHGLATAAIIQYGDFPIEQAVIERALAECKI